MSTEQERQRRSQLQHDAEHTPPHKKVSVMGYLAILFAAAFLLLLLSYFMQQRANREAVENLTQTSNSAVQSLDNILAERDRLREENNTLREENQRLQTELEQQTALAQEEYTTLDGVVRAMDLFWQIDEAYVRGRYTLCRSLIQSMEEAELTDFLPKDSTTGNGRYAPYDRYREIYDALY